MDKKELRKEIRIRKKACSSQALLDMSLQITGKIENHQRFIEADTVLLYHSLDDEVNTHSLVEKYRNRKNIILPVVVGDELELRLYNGNLKMGAFNILEPDGELWTDTDRIQLAIIPGMAFDKECNRLGRGKGYYDKTLCRLDCYKIGICFPFQYLDHIPNETHDIKMDEIITL